MVLANAYVDLGTWWCMTPFIGAGVGGARVSIDNFTDQSIVNNGGGALPVARCFGDNASKWNLAWALHAGVAYKVTPNFTVELAYRYLDMGDGLTGDLRTFDGINNINNPMTFKDITSHDLKSACAGTLESAGLRAAADAQGLIEPPFAQWGINGAGSSRAVFLRARSATDRSRFPFKIVPIGSRDNDWLRLTGDDQRRSEFDGALRCVEFCWRR